MLPIVFFEGYLTLTVLLFAFGPWPYPVYDGTRLYTFLALAHLALLIGYISGTKRPLQRYTGSMSPSRLVLISVILNAVLFIPTISFRTGAWLPNIVGGLADPGAAYEHSNNIRTTGLPLIEYIRFFVGLPLSLLLPLTVFYWKQLNTSLRVATVACIAGVAVLFVGMGTNQALANIVVLMPWLVLASYFAGNWRASWSRVASTIVAAGGLLALFLFFFASTQMTRTGSSAKAGYFSQINLHADYNNAMIQSVPKDAQPGVLGLVSYMSQGYYALYLALDKPYVPSYGVGNSMFLYRQAARLPGLSWLPDTPYPVRIEEDGWSAYGLFSTIYPWIASDVTFPGALLIIFLIGRGFALTWCETLTGRNPFAVAMFTQFLIMLYYFSANNQCLQSGEGFAAFWGTCFMWLSTRQRVRHVVQLQAVVAV